MLDRAFLLLSFLEDVHKNGEKHTLLEIEHIDGGRFKGKIHEYESTGLVCKAGKNSYGEDLYTLTDLGMKAVREQKIIDDLIKK